MDFKRKEITLNFKTKLLFQWLNEAIKAQSLPHTKVIEAFPIEAGINKIIMPAVSIHPASLTYKVYEEYNIKLCSALISTGYGPKHTEAPVFDNHFVVAWEILLRIVAQMSSTDGSWIKWFAVYKDFAEKINHSTILHVGYFSKKHSALNLLLNDVEMNQKLEELVINLDAIYRDITNLPDDEKERVLTRRRKICISALQSLSLLGERGHAI